jgi:AmmeMemoRadiSam system protein A
VSLPRLARRAIARALGTPAADAAIAVRDERRGVFVTLRRRADGELRGCVGVPEPRLPLAEAVEFAAVGAALRDRRFPPVTAPELASLAIHVSVLGPLVPCAAAEVQVGRHGVVIRRAGRIGLLLPQVALEQGWDAHTLLGQLCRKAGLPSGAWRDPDAELLRFETETETD